MLPEPILIGAVVGAVALAVLLIYGLVAVLLPTAQTDPDRESLADAAMAVREPRTWSGRLDRGFNKVVRGTLLGVSTERAVEWMLFAGVVAAAGVFLLTSNLYLAVLAFVVAPLIPLLVFVSMQSRYRGAVQEQLPEGVSQLSRSMKAGLVLEDALRQSVTYSEHPLKEVFGRIGGRMAMGVTGAAAFRATADELDLQDFDSLAAVVALHGRTGGNLPAMLDRLAASIRDRNQFRGYFRSAISVNVATAAFVALVPIAAAVLYSIFYPDLFRNFLDTTTGVLMLAGAAVFWVLGVLTLVWLIRRQSRY